MKIARSFIILSITIAAALLFGGFLQAQKSLTGKRVCIATLEEVGSFQPDKHIIFNAEQPSAAVDASTEVQVRDPELSIATPTADSRQSVVLII